MERKEGVQLLDDDSVAMPASSSSSGSSHPINAKARLLFHGLLKQCSQSHISVPEYIDRIMDRIQKTRFKEPLATLCFFNPTKDCVITDSKGQTGDRVGHKSKIGITHAHDPFSFDRFLPSGRDVDKFVQRHVVNEFIVRPDSLCYYVVVPRESPRRGMAGKDVPMVGTSKLGIRPEYDVYPVCLPAYQARVAHKSQARYYMAFGRGVRVHSRSVAHFNYVMAGYRSKLFPRLQHLEQLVERSRHDPAYIHQLKKRKPELEKTQQYNDDRIQQNRTDERTHQKGSDGDGENDERSAKRLKTIDSRSSTSASTSLSSSTTESDSESDSVSDSDSESESDRKRRNDQSDEEMGVTPPPVPIQSSSIKSKQRIKVEMDEIRHTDKHEIDTIHHPVIQSRQPNHEKYATASILSLTAVVFDYPVLLRCPRRISDLSNLPRWGDDIPIISSSSPKSIPTSKTRKVEKNTWEPLNIPCWTRSETVVTRST